MVTVGTDIIEVARINKALTRTDRFVNKVFTKKEINYCSKKAFPEQHYAGRFAAKEALKKAIMSMKPEIKTLPFRLFEINNEKNGKPTVKILQEKYSFLENKYNLEITISHTSSLATATAIMEKL
jgi:holo-[acyl-carrier protein] synthase